MNEALRDRGILDVIGMLSSQRASGALQVSTGLTEGALFFDRGQLVDARLGKLTGFQAINALASVPDGSYNFDPAIAPPAQSSITASERLLLKDFFGIEVFDPEQSHDVDLNWSEDGSAPEQVVPLSSVEPEYVDDQPLTSKADDEATVVRPKPAVAEPQPPPSYAPVAEPPPPLSYAPIARSTFRPALLLILLTVLVAAAAVAFLYRFRKPDSSASVAPAVQTATPADVPQEPKTETTSAVPDLTGNWKVTNTVEQTSYQAYKNMEIGFNVSINQAGKDFTGKGEKISENGRSLPADGRTPIEVKGTIDGDKVEATFSEHGALRKTNGRFVWKIDKGSGGLTGTFVSTAARTSGKSAATKVL